MAPRNKAEPGTALTVPAEMEGELLPNMNIDVAVGRLITTSNTGIGEIKDSYEALKTKGDLVVYAGTIEGNAALKAHIKLCSGLRTALDRVHKDAKAPFLDATRSLDGRLKELKGEVERLEDVAKSALNAFANREAEEARARQAAMEAELAAAQAELAKYKKVTEEAGITHPFIDRSVVVTVRGKPAYEAAVSLFGDAYDEVKTDENGVNYVLEVVLRRKEIQEV